MRARPLLSFCAFVLVTGFARGEAGAGGREDDRTQAPAANVLREHVRVVDRPWQRVGLTVTIMNRRGEPVRGLAREAFRLFEDGREVAIADFGVEGSRGDRPLSVAVLLDLSQSMAGQIGKVREAARALLTGLRPGDEILVAKFNDQLTVLQPFTGDPDEPERTLKSVGRARGGTALFRAVEETLKDLRGRSGRKVILAVSDGLDNDVARGQHVLQSLYLNDLLRLCFRTRTTVYGIRPGMPSSWMPFEGFVEETGGRLLYTGGDLERLFARLGEEFLSQYYLAYDIDPKAREGQRRRIRVEVTIPGVVVRAMGGYETPRSRLQTLLSDLRDEDPEMRADAAFELGFTGEPQASRALVLALTDREEAVRRLAAESLGRLADPAAAGALVERLGDRAESVRAAAADAIRGLGPAAVPALADEVAAGARRRKAPPALVPAARLLGEVGDERAIDPLALLLREGPDGAGVAAARALGALGLTGGVPALRSALSRPQPAVRGAAIEAIHAIAGRAAWPVLQAHLDVETDPAVRALVVRVLEDH
jgi:VWFA-related protein